MTTATAINIAEYDEIRAGIDAIKNAADFIPDVSSKKGHEASKRVSLDIGKVLTNLDAKRKDKKAYFIAGGKEVDGQARTIREELEALQLPHKTAYKDSDTAKKKREQDRIDALQARLDEIVDMPENVRDGCAQEVKEAHDCIRSMACDDFYEFEVAALKARNSSADQLARMFAQKEKEEADAAELAKLKAEQAERERKQREDEIAEKASREANERAEAAQAQAAKAEQDRVDAEKQAVIQREAYQRHQEAQAAKAEEDRKAAAIAAEEQRKADIARHAQEVEQARIDAEARAKAQAEQAERDKAAAEERAKLQAAQAVEQERQRQAAAELAEKQAEEDRQANKRHVGAVRKAAKEALMALGVDEPTAKKIVLAVHDKKIPGISISY